MVLFIQIDMKNVDLIVLRAITTQQKRLSLSNKKLYHLPYNIEFLNWLVILDLRSNNLSDLPILPKHVSLSLSLFNILY